MRVCLSAPLCLQLRLPSRFTSRPETWDRAPDPKLITLIRHKSLFYKEGQANLRIGSCLQFKWHLEQVQGTLL
jgi:hypothetical protein